MNVFKSNLFIVLVVSIGTLICAEFALRAFGFERFQTWLELTERGTFQNRPNFTAWGQTIDGEDVFYQFDEFGNRKSNEIHTNDSTQKVAVFGDSFAFGLYLPDSITITEKLQRRVSKNIQFINAGVGGSGTADHLLYLQSLINKTSVDEIILLLNYDDVDRMISKNLYVLRNDSLIESKRWDKTSLYNQVFTTSGFSFLEKNSVIFALISRFLWANLFFEDDYELNSAERKYTWPSNEELQASSEYATELWMRLVLEMKSICEAKNIEFRLATTGFEPDSNANPRSFQMYKQLDAFVQKEKITFLDIRPVLKDAVQGDWNKIRLKGDSHPNSLGTSLISKAIADTWYNQN